MMSEHVQGIVQKISEKSAGRSGDIVYNICIDTGGREDKWFGHGFDEPVFQEGDEIEFDIEYNGDYANVDNESVQVLSEGDGGVRSSSSSSRRSSSRSNGRSNSGGRAKPAAKRSSSRKPATKARAKPEDDTKMSKDDWAKKDQMIRRQACMNTSIALIRGALECGAVVLPTKKGDKFDAYIALCDEEADRLYDQYEEQVYPKAKAPSRRGGRSAPAEEDYADDIPY